MTTLIHDPFGLADCAVILVCGAFDVWWFSPVQRAKRRRERARDRALLRRAFTEPATARAASSAPRDQENQK